MQPRTDVIKEVTNRDGTTITIKKLTRRDGVFRYSLVANNPLICMYFRNEYLRLNDAFRELEDIYFT